MALEFGNMTSSDAVFDLNDCRNALETEYSVNGKSIAQSLALHGGDIYVNSSRLSTVQEAVQALADSFDEKQPKIPEEKLEAVSNVDAERRATLELLYPDGAVYYTSQQTAECPVQIADEEWHGPVQAANGLWMWGKEAEITSPMTTFVLADGTIEKHAIDGTIGPQWMIDNGFYDGSSWLKSIKSVSIGEDVTTISSQTFKGCNSLTSINFGRQLSAIGSSAFENAKGLLSIDIPDNVVSVAGKAFWGCSNMTKAVVRNGVSSITTSTFQGCNGLLSVSLGNSLTVIGMNAFEACRHLTTINIPEGVRGIGYRAFIACESLEEITLPNSLTGMANQVFKECTNLKSVIVGSQVGSIGENTFASCPNIEKVVFLGKTLAQISAMNNHYWGLTEDKIIPGIVEDEVLYTTAANPNTWLTSTPIFDSSTGRFDGFSEKAQAVKVVIPSSVNGIDVSNIYEQSFYNCADLTNVIFPNTVLSIDGFSFCSALTCITIPDSVISIKQAAFYKCTNLSYVIFKGNAPAVGTNAFKDVASGCKAVISSTATGFDVDSQGKWNGLIVEVQS